MTYSLAAKTSATGSPRTRFSTPSKPRLRPNPRYRQRLRAVVLGAGTVNGGVLDKIGVLSERIEIAAIVTRKSRQGHDPRQAWLTDINAAFDTGPDVVIEALPDCALAERALKLAASRGCHIISANKAVLARCPQLAGEAERHGGSLRYSAAVAGGIPVLETLTDLRKRGEVIAAVRGVLNGTSNYVLDQIERGAEREAAVKAAQRAGFAEADPSADIDGLDAAAKLVLIARKAFDLELDVDTIGRIPLSALHPGQAKAASGNRLRYRQCAELSRRNGRIKGRVDLQALANTDELTKARNEENIVVITCESGLRVQLHGKGAGRVPTADAMLTDIRDLIACEIGA